MRLHQLLEATDLSPLTSAWEANGGWVTNLISLLKDMGEKESMLASMLEKAIAKHAKTDPTRLFGFLPHLIDTLPRDTLTHGSMTTSHHNLMANSLMGLVSSLTARALEVGDVAVKALTQKVPLETLDRFISPKKRAELRLAVQRLARSKEDEQYDAENDLFVFIGRPTFKEVPEGSGNYRKTLDIEQLIKVDGYDAEAHQMVGMMKLRARVQGEGSEVYSIRLPAGTITAKTTSHLDDYLVDLIDKHKQVVR